MIGLQPAQGVFDLLVDPIAARIAKHFAVAPFEPNLGGDQKRRAQAIFCNRLADNLLGAAEAIDRSRVDDIDAMLQRGADR